MILIFSLLLSIMARAESGQALNLYVENDTRDLAGPGSDNAYTSGLKLSYIYGTNQLPSWSEPFIKSSEMLKKNLQKSESNFSIALGQQIYTPNNVGATELIVDDRPYAGWLYLGLSAHFKDSERSHVIEMDVGWIGPEAGGESVQNGFHRMTGVNLAQGWKNQLGSEATLQFSYQQRRRFYSLQSPTYKKYFDIIPLYGLALGNVAVNASGGVLLRLGTHLPDDFGPTRASLPEGDAFVEPVRKNRKDTSLYFFTGGRAIGVVRNIFLDGNSFRSSPRVHKKPFVLETELGVGAHFSDWVTSWSFISRSPEFDERNNYNSFAAISVAYSY